MTMSWLRSLSCRLAWLLAAGLSTAACFVDKTYSNETVVEFEACATFGDRCGDLTDFRVVSHDLGEEGEAVVGDRVRFLNVQPNRIITFEVQGLSNTTILYTATCDIGATAYTTVEADCRNNVVVNK